MKRSPYRKFIKWAEKQSKKNEWFFEKFESDIEIKMKKIHLDVDVLKGCEGSAMRTFDVCYSEFDIDDKNSMSRM